LPRSAPHIALALAAALTCGAVGGYTAAVCRDQSRAETAPEGWERIQTAIAYRRPELLGELPLDPGAWALDHYQSLRAGAPGALTATARLPGGGVVYLFPSIGGGRVPNGPALMLRRGAEPAAAGVNLAETGEENALNCEGTLPPPDDSPYTAAVSLSGSVLTASAGGQTLTCRASAQQGPAALRSGLQRVLVADVALDDAPVPPPVSTSALAMGAAAGAVAAAALLALELWLGASPLLAAAAFAPLLLGLLTAGRDGAVAVEALRLGLLSGRWLPVTGPLALLILAKVLHHGARLSRPVEGDGAAFSRSPKVWAVAAAAWLPAGLAVGLTTRSPLATVGGLLAAPALALGVGVALRALSGFGGATLARGSAAVGLAASAAGLAAWLSGASYAGAPLYLAAAGAAVGALVWANANPLRVRGYNLLSLALFTAGLLLLDFGLRFTSLQGSWSDIGAGAVADSDLGWVPQTWAQFDAIEAAQHTDYPDEGYPVGYGPKAAPNRIVCMGGSSTGGAFQNDDISQFYPARLAERLAGRAEVLNQGVGSWTTLHIAEYARRSLVDLEADVVTVYVGHNDQFTDMPMTQKELLARWQSGGASRQTAGVLRRALLYNGLRYAIDNLRDAQSVAVPVSHARENLTALADMTRAQGAKLLLMSEGLNPDPGALAPYWDMMEAVAEEREDVAWLDTAWMLHTRSQGMFLDNCHLSDTGHRAVAGAMAERLDALGWVPTQ